MASDSNGLFVYGTLMRDEVAHDMVCRAETIVPARARGRLYELPAGYPALINVDDPAGFVIGELCLFDEISQVLEALDAYEGNEYVRVRKPVVALEPAHVRTVAWCYVIPPEHEPALIRAGARRWPHNRGWSSKNR